MKQESKKEEMTSDSTQTTDIKLHENGVIYKEVPMEGLDEPFKLFNSLKPARLEGEKYSEYKVRRLLNNKNDKRVLFHNSGQLGTYIKNK